MRVSRRDFLKYCIGSAAAMGLDLSTLGTLEKALASGKASVIWLNGSNCTGCTVSLANRISGDAPVDLTDLLINTLDLKFHPNLMGAAGELAVEELNKTSKKKDFILAIEGGIPTAFEGLSCVLWTEKDGHEVTALEAVQRLAPKASAVLCIGTCASFGGIPAAGPNPTGVVSVSEATKDLRIQSMINIPGCPSHPDWVIGTIAQLLAGAPPELDADKRPTVFFGGEVFHKRCPRLGTGCAEHFGIDGLCMRKLGCKGPRTHSTCPELQWNGKTNWCIGANSICLGCTENGFPDSFAPFFKSECMMGPGKTCDAGSHMCPHHSHGDTPAGSPHTHPAS